MHRVLISLAANTGHEDNLRKAREALTQVLQHAVYTRELWTEPEGSKAHLPAEEAASPDSKAQPSKYLNQLVSAETLLGADELNVNLKNIELQMGRTPALRRQGIVPIDLDLLAHEGRRFHLRDWQRSYVRRLLPELGNYADTDTDSILLDTDLSDYTD